MYGWCEKCHAVVLDGKCSEHGKTRPISFIGAVDVHPLPEFERRFLNRRMKNLQLKNGIFLVYGDRMFHRRIVALDKPLVEVKLRKDGTHIRPLARGKVEGIETRPLIQANSERINRLSEVTKQFAKWELDESETGNAVISFSGGKDSTVLAHLLDEFKLRKVFIDTTIEFPETYAFVKGLKEKGWDIDITRAKKNFFNLCEREGYPKFKNRWCCKTQKFEPFANYVTGHFDGEKVLVFSAERRWEAINRLEQPMKKPHKHILNQETCQYFLDWLSLDVWIYTWMNKLPVNEVYKYYDRGGCWPCPFGLQYRLHMLKYAHPKLYKVLQNLRTASAQTVGGNYKPCGSEFTVSEHIKRAREMVRKLNKHKSLNQEPTLNDKGIT